MTRLEDVICDALLFEEGTMMQRLLQQQRVRPNEASILSLTLLPFIALIEHDAIPYLQARHGISLPQESQELARTRHLTKLLDAKHLTYERYSELSQNVILASKMKFSTPKPLALIPFFASKDIGIYFYESLPICTTHLISYKLEDPASPYLLGSEKEYYLKYGETTGRVGSVLYKFAELLAKDENLFSARPFHVTANDFSYSNIMRPLFKKGIKDETVFFFVSELLSQIASVTALRRAGFIDQLLWLKLSTYCLYHAEKALGSFSSFVRDIDNQSLFSSEFVSELSTVVSRDERKIICRSRSLRNAFIHYDFAGITQGLNLDNYDFLPLMSTVISRTVGMSYSEYADFLESTSMNLIGKLSELVCFPSYNPRKNVFA